MHALTHVQADTERLAVLIKSKLGKEAAAYHAGMSDENRRRVHNDWSV